MFSLLRPISLRRVGEHRLRTAMTVLGIALGVAVLVAVIAVNRGIIDSFSSTLDDISGRVHLEVKGGDTGIDQHLLEKIREVPGVLHATPVIQRTLDVADGQGDGLVLLGLDFTEDPKTMAFFYQLDSKTLRKPAAQAEKSKDPKDEDFDSDPFAMLDAQRQLVVTEKFAQRWHKKPGETIDLLTRQGTQPFTLYAVVQAQGPLRAMGGQVAILDYLDAQEIFDLPGRVDRFDVAVANAKDADQLESTALAIRKAIGSEFTVERPGKRQERQEELLHSFKLALAVGAGVALIVGMFLIYHTLSISVAQRRREIGILRATGATRGQLVQLFTLEGAVLGALGAMLGCGLGTVLARSMMVQSAASVSELYMRVDSPKAEVPPWAYAVGLLVGIGSSALASLLPAWQASRMSPVVTIRSAGWDAQGTQGLRWTGREWTALLLYGAVPLVAQGPAIAGFPVFGLVSMFLVVLASTLMTRWLVLLGHRLLGPIAPALFGLEGRLAADNVGRNAGKSAVTVASLMVGLSMVIGSAILTNSFRYSIDTWIQQTVPADLFITSGHSTGGIKNNPLDPQLADEIAKIPGVAMVDTVRLRQIDFERARVLLLALQIHVRFARNTAWPIARSSLPPGELVTALEQGKGVVISETLSHRFNKHPGQLLSLQTVLGRRDFPILATMTDYSSDQGAIFMDRTLYEQHWRDNKVDTFEPYLEKGANSELIRQEILKRWGAKYHLFALTNVQFREVIGAMIERIFAITKALEMVTIFISLLSVVNTLLTAVLDRMREIGVLRAIGLLRGQLTRLIVLESAMLSFAGASIGILVGTINGLIILKVVNEQDTGWQVPLHIPVGVTAAYALVLLAVGVIAAIYPARVAGRVRVIDALGYE